MKKLLFLFISFIALNKTKAQIVFCPPGAEWNYTFKANITGRIGNEKIAYTGTATIGNETVKVLSHRYFFNYLNDLQDPLMQTYIKQNGDTIFMKNTYTQNVWQILYNFNVLPGHSWQNLVYARLHTFMVDSLNFVTINGFSLKRIYGKYSYNNSSSGYIYPVSITERIGCSEYLFDFYGSFNDGDYFQDFLCYKDNAFGQKQFTNKPCDFVNYVGITETTFDENSVSIFPNPTSGNLTVRLSSEKSVTLTLHNSLGQLVYSGQHLNSETELDLSFLPAGIYYLMLKNNLEQKVVKVVRE